MKRAIVNVAVGQGYPSGQHRLQESLDVHRFHDGGRVLFTNQYPPGSPTHEETPYAFKLFAIREAMKLGYTSILWMDSWGWIVKPIEPLFELIEREGHYFFYCGHSLGQRCSDECLRLMGETDREPWFNVPLVGGSAYGFDFTNPRTMKFWDEWWKAFDLGAFKGFTINENTKDDMSGLKGRPKGFVSDDPRVQGHCHDESCATIIAHRLGMHSTGQHIASSQSASHPDIYIVTQGM